ncbi:molybdopterin synthase catalytic subunit MoaE [Shewanella sp. Choline-02u-19]|jgi:molybdopterin synthase catalytic subunit|uniref:molybdopterin synthase catalytic subunit MoaE n=1 Tax=unclassified Shewanella TaxID=196818 RepID=UPI000C34B153|nr:MULTISPECIES: molybdopterin synthase catalytic subunit MoaE [unclassified Shewanella]PKG72889.1 molybdopterin synthase catalytic subunit MoaE [Shewanella sp. GutCb]PKH58211.1 molybdopterin synthase catalytic subunit MoaE [Shewanella sp. Bg11-22]PKI29526.1 molybdopterin synthase catalytic subunit MoaE [Shewanella sp. Choline-02u-19]
MIRVQTADFSVPEEYQLISQENGDGAVVTFVGKVRDFNDGSAVTDLTLEHYPGMTEAVLNQIEAEARERWALNHVTIIHRVGRMALGEQIVFIGVTSAHRKAAFAACEFLIDFLKTKAPFWKLEAGEEGASWVEARDSDEQAANVWNKK